MFYFHTIYYISIRIDINLKIVIPNTQSIEKKNTLKELGAELIEVDAVPYANPENYIKKSKICDKVFLLKHF